MVRPLRLEFPGALEGSEILGNLCFHRAPTPSLWQIEPDEGFSLLNLFQESGHLELKTFGRVKHGDVPQEGQAQ